MPRGRGRAGGAAENKSGLLAALTVAMAERLVGVGGKSLAAQQLLPLFEEDLDLFRDDALYNAEAE
jgi:hypothetical protein